MKRLTKKQMWIFAIGQLGWSILGGIMNAWFITFYLPTTGEAPSYVTQGLVIGGFLTVLGLIAALSHVFDAVTDPLVASISDRCKSKRGRRIPFMQIAAVPFAALTVLLFTPLFNSVTGNTIWISVIIILFYAFMTLYCTPYNALISEFGKTQEDRMFISTAISLTYFAGTLLANVPSLIVASLQKATGDYAWGWRIPIIVLAVIAAVCMLIPTFLLKEKELVDTKPVEQAGIRSLAATFKNQDFRAFALSDLMYWVGLTLFQTGLPFFVRVSMGFSLEMVMFFMGGMTVLSAAFYPFVTKLVKKFGKKKLVIAGFIGLAICYGITAISSIPGFLPNEGNAGILSWVFGIVIMLISALPMALLGIIPQSMVADVAESEAKATGENRDGMFFAARTFAMKIGTAIAMVVFTSLAIIGADKQEGNEITATKTGLMIAAIAAVVFCVLGAVILMFYREKKIMKSIAKKEDEEFMRVVEQEKE